ncbi:MAG: MmgE/PrpD family protein [Rhodospirillaceae bacterium]
MGEIIRKPRISGHANGGSDMMRELTTYMAGAPKKALPAAVVEKTKHHVADTLAAILSGSELEPGSKALQFVKSQGGTKEACVMGSHVMTSAVHAAFANPMSAHADETDDSHQSGFFHPGCAIVPAAWAVAERRRATGRALLRAVALGYDVGARINMALGGVKFSHAGHSTHSFGALFGAAAAAGALSGFDARRMQHLMSYTAQQASGVSCWMRDPDHIEKAFDFGGMPARNGVYAAAMVEHGFTGVEDVFSGPNGFWQAYDDCVDTSHVTRELGETYEIMRSNIKKWSVGSPIQPALDAMERIICEHGVRAGDVERVRVQVQDSESDIVNDRNMPDICLQHLVAVMLLDGRVTFASSHDARRMADRKVLDVRKRIEYRGSPELTRAGGRQAIVEVWTHDGSHFFHHTPIVAGAWERPLSRQEVDDKCHDLIAQVTGTRRARELLDRVWMLDKVGDVSELRRCWWADASPGRKYGCWTRWAVPGKSGPVQWGAGA